jgi:hypothetical protein
LERLRSSLGKSKLQVLQKSCFVFVFELRWVGLLCG